MFRLRGTVFTLIAASLALFLLIPAASAQEKPATIGDAFVDEELSYDIGFWFFEDVARGRLALKSEGEGRYIATLTAYTTGVVRTLTRQRKDVYISRLRLSEDGSRFVTESFEKAVEMGGKTRRSRHVVDHKAGTVEWRSWGGGKDEKTGSARIPEGVHADDPIAAFYNFRFGVYGEISEGKEYRIATFPKEEKFPEITIRMATAGDLKRRRPGVEAGLLADAKIDKELFGSRDGELEILFTRGMLPVQAVAKGVLLFGDVRGRLREVSAGKGVLTKAE